VKNPKVAAVTGHNVGFCLEFPSRTMIVGAGVTTTSPTGQLQEPPAALRFRRQLRFDTAMSELWQARGLVRTLAERDLRVRYKRTFLGVGWAVINPVLFMVVFTFFFQKSAHIVTGGVPYALFAYIALVPWSFFAQATSAGSASLLSNMSLLNKVYCPREVFPITAIITAGFDALVASAVLVMLFIAYGYPPATATVWVPLLVIIEVAFALGLTLFMCSTLIYLRDLRYAVPLIVQLGMFISPVAYSITAIPRGLRPYYDVLNPMGPILDSFRRTVLHNLAPDGTALALAGAASAVWLVGGYSVFKRLETGFADFA